MGLAENLKKIRRERGFSQVGLAKAADVSQQLISQIERNENVATTRLPDIARALKVPVAEIDPDYAELGIGPIIKAPLLSWVSAGTLADPQAQIDIEGAKPIAAPGLDPDGRWIALRVEGDSMNRISPHESVILVNLNDRKEVPNACYVIATESGDATYKRYRPSKPYWHPVSTNRKHKPLSGKEVPGVKIVGRVRRSILEM